MCSAAYERWRRVLGLQLGWHGEPSRLHLARAGQGVAGVHTRLLGIRVGCGHMLGRLWWRPDERPCTGCVWTGCSGVGRLAHVRTLPPSPRLSALRFGIRFARLSSHRPCVRRAFVRACVRAWFHGVTRSSHACAPAEAKSTRRQAWLAVSALTDSRTECRSLSRPLHIQPEAHPYSNFRNGTRTHGDR